MDKTYIVMGRKASEKQERARQFRREMTPAETRLWEGLRNNRLNGLHFRRQQVIDGFIADFYCHAAGLIVEVDGGVHEMQADYDRLRGEILATRQLRILRFPNERIFNDVSTVLSEILEVATQQIGKSKK